MDLLSPQINYPFYPSVSSFMNDFYDDYLTTEELVIPLTPKYLNLHQRQLPALYPNYLLNNPNYKRRSMSTIEEAKSPYTNNF